MPDVADDARLTDALRKNQSVLRDQIIGLAGSLAAGAGAGALGGGVAALATYTAVASLASASTGTAIASLAGVVATNATLAALGGGSLAVGGLGMAGGTMVLTGIVMAPVAALVGVAFTIKGRQLREQQLEVQRKIEEAEDDLEHMRRSIDQFKQWATQEGTALRFAVPLGKQALEVLRSGLNVPTVRWTRLNAHYRAAVELARLLLQMRTVDVRNGMNQTVALSIDMAVLFEEFVRTALREALACTSAQFPTGSGAPRFALDKLGLIRLEPDLSYWPSGTCAFIGDVKYKRDTGAGKSADLYQLLAYATAVRLPSATLIYADGPPEPLSHYVPATGARLDIRHLDLTQTPSAVLQQLKVIAHDIRRASTPTATAESPGLSPMMAVGTPG